jgi:hypothetical protein
MTLWPIVALAVALLVSNAIWLFKLIDAGVKLADQSSEVLRLRRVVDILILMTNDGRHASDSEEIERRLQERFPDILIKQVDNTVEVDDLVFVFQDGRLIAVRMM